MHDYTFRFRNEHSLVEAEFTLHFDTDELAKLAAHEFEQHSYFPVIEVLNGAELVHRINRATPARSDQQSARS